MLAARRKIRIALVAAALALAGAVLAASLSQRKLRLLSPGWMRFSGLAVEAASKIAS